MRPLTQLSLDLPTEAHTLAWGTLLAQHLTAGQVLHLNGNLGAGKTCLSRAIIQGLGHAGRVKSPTYALLESYTLRLGEVYHFDLYRFNNPDEWHGTGFEEYFTPHTLCLIEWAEKAMPFVPAPTVTIDLALKNDGRHAKLTIYQPNALVLLQQSEIFAGKPV